MQSRNEVGILQTKRLLIEPMSRAAFLRALGDETYSAQEHAVYAELEERYQADSRNRFSFFTNRLIRRRSDGVTVGSIAYMSDPRTDEQALLEIGYETLEVFRGRGYATEALEQMCRAGLQIPGCAGMIAGVELSNTASMRVLEKCGFVCTDRSTYLQLAIYQRKLLGGQTECKNI